MATGGILATPVAGPLLERNRAIGAERGTDLARRAVRVTEVGEEHRPHSVVATRPATAVAAYPGGVVPEVLP